MALADLPAALEGLDAHPHARALLASVLAGTDPPSHAYLFHGPAGTGKRTIARAFAAALLAHGAGDPEAVTERVARGSHPDLTWVTPSGAAEMLVSDIDEAVVAAAARTPFEAARRVFVIEDADALNEQAANRMLKTLEEPPSFVHLLLLTSRLGEVMPTIVSRCQLVRFDPLAPERIAADLSAGGELSGTEAEHARACARLALGDAARAALLAGEQGAELRASAEDFVRQALAGDTAARPWVRLLELARAAGARAGEQAMQRVAGELELLPAKERKRHEREAGDTRRRVERRARTATLDLLLGLVELWLRDLLCLHEGAPELIHALDRRSTLEADAADRDPARLREGIERVADTRLRLALHVSEELALEALAYRLGGRSGERAEIGL